MPKKIYENFNLGQYTEMDRNVPDGYFYSGRGIDIYKDKGYLYPGKAQTTITITGLSTNVVDIIPDFTNSNAYVFTNIAKMYRLNNIAGNDSGAGSIAIEADFGGVGQNYYTVTGMAKTKGLIYPIAGTDKVVWAYKTSSTGYIATGNLTGAWSPTLTYKTLSTGAQNGPADIIDWQSYLWVTSDRYIDRLDPLTEGWTTGAFDLGTGWSAKCLFTTPNYLGIFAEDKNKNTKVYFIDGRSQTAAVKIMPLNGVWNITGCRNLNGNIYFFADNKKGSLSGSSNYTSNILGRLNDNGYDTISELTQDISNVKYHVAGSTQGAIETFDERILCGTTVGIVLSYGKSPLRETNSLTSPIFVSNTLTAVINSIKVIDVTRGRIALGIFDGTDYLLKYIDTNSNSSTAEFRPAYTDLGQDCMINYIKVFYKTPASGDSTTVSIDTDYGVNTLLQRDAGVISYTKDRGTYSKKFDTGNLPCHSFRPKISWTAGSLGVSKIIIDYSFVDDN